MDELQSEDEQPLRDLFSILNKELLLKIFRKLDYCSKVKFYFLGKTCKSIVMNPKNWSGYLHYNCKHTLAEKYFLQFLETGLMRYVTKISFGHYSCLLTPETLEKFSDFMPNLKEIRIGHCQYSFLFGNRTPERIELLTCTDVAKNKQKKDKLEKLQTFFYNFDKLVIYKMNMTLMLHFYLRHLAKDTMKVIIMDDDDKILRELKSDFIDLNIF
jgi:hypothetical protein